MMLLWKFVIFIALCKAVCMVPDTVADNVNSSPCEDGWEPYGDEYCSKAFRSQETWQDASNSCIDNGGYLASIHSKEQNDIIEDSIKQLRMQPLWIGLHVDLNDKYVWVDGTQVDYTNWAPGEPDGGFIPGDCVIVSNIYIGMWSVYPCNREFFYICQKKVSTTISTSTGIDKRQVTTTAIMRTEVNNIPDTTIEAVSPCENGWKHFGGEYCFKLQELRTNWKDASSMCVRMGGHLASIHSKEQNDKFEDLEKESDPDVWWIGLHDHDLDSKYVWDDEANVDYVNWGYNEPDGGFTLGDCVIIRIGTYLAGNWYVLPCQRNLPSVCQKKIPTNVITSTELDDSSVTPSVIESDETATRNLPAYITTSKTSAASDCFISVTTYIIIVIVILFLVLTGGMLYYKRLWIQEKRLKVAAIFFRKS